MRREIILKAVILVSGLVFCLAPYRASGDVFSDKEQIESLIQAGELTDAQAQIEQLKTDYSQDPQLPCALFWIGRRYEWSNRDDKAKEIYQQIIQNYPGNPYAARASIGLVRMQVLSLIISGKYAQSEEALNELVTDFPDNPDLPETLYWIARRYGWSDKYEEEKDTYQKIIQNYSASSFAAKAQLGFSRANVLSLILSKKFDQAEAAFDKLTADFAKHPGLPDAFYWIAERYRWSNKPDKYEDAKNIYQRILQDYPGSSCASRAALGFSNVEVLSLIVSQNYNEAKEALDKLVIAFSEHPDLPGKLYWIGREYGWSERYEEEKAVYQRIIQNQPDSSYASKAKLGFARAQIQSLIVSRNYDEAKEAFDKLVSDFNDRPDLPETLYRIAERYWWLYKYEDANDIYQRIVQQYPDSTEAGKAKLGIAKTNVCSYIFSGQTEAAQTALNKLISNFINHPALPTTMLFIAEQCAMRISEDENEGDAEQAKNYYLEELVILEKIITELPASAAYTSSAYYYSALCYHRLGEHEKAVKCCKQIVENWPDYKYAGQARFMTEHRAWDLQMLDPNNSKL